MREKESGRFWKIKRNEFNSVVLDSGDTAKTSKFREKYDFDIIHDIYFRIN